MIKLEGSYLAAIEIIEPDEFISSDKIEQTLAPVYDRLKLPYGRIEMQTGVKDRGVYHDLKPSDIAAKAAVNLFKNHKTKASDIDLLIYAGVCRDQLEPSTASRVHDLLGLSARCQSFDLSNACLGVINAMVTASGLIQAGQASEVLIVTGENSKPLLEQTIKTLLADSELTRKGIKKYFANFTIGSCGLALVVSKEKNNSLATLNYASSLSDSSVNHLCQGGGNLEALTMETDSEQLMQAGVKLAKENWQQFMTHKYDHYICHQVGVHHRDFLYQHLELDLNKDTTTFDRYGNTGSAALPLTLYKAKITSAQRVALLGIGSGLHTIAMDLTWN